MNPSVDAMFQYTYALLLLSGAASQLSSSANGNLNNGGYADGGIGFRIASVPEPSALSLLAIGLGGLAMMRRRRS
jgi:hypothetical protein